MPTAHSNVMGGSSAAKRLNCPASYKLELNMPDEPASEFADRGSMLHAAMELIITADPVDMEEAEPLFNELEGQDMGFTGHEITRELIDEKLRPAMQAWFEVVDFYGIDDWFIEQRVSLEEIVDGAFGTADIIAKDVEGRLHVLDWKFGDGVPVPVEGNVGAGFYAAGAMYDPDPELVEFSQEISAVVLHIVQPRTGRDENPLQTWETTEDWVENLVDQVAEAIEKAHSANPPAKVGAWCRWCKAKPTCPEYGRIGDEALSKAPESMDAVELAAAMEKADLLKTWIDSVYTLAMQEMESGAAVPGYKLVQKQARRVWTDPAAVEKAMRKGKLKVAQIFKKTLISPAQAEKINKALYSKTLSDMVKLHSSGLTIVPDSDKREAYGSQSDLLTNALGKVKQTAKTERGKA